ncbi:MAG: ORF6N domain-containing protein [Candidatus Margulisiibacteriota bacterium]
MNKMKETIKKHKSARTERRSAEKSDSSLVPAEIIEQKIFLIRGQKVMFDKDLAFLYRVKTKELNKAVSRNKNRFPEDFIFKLTKDEFYNLRFHFGTSSYGGRRYLPSAFTEQGIAMLSSVLKSERAMQVNIAIMRAFVRIRQLIASNKELIQKLAEIEHKIGQHDQDINELFAAVSRILRYEEGPKRKFGFV